MDTDAGLVVNAGQGGERRLLRGGFLVLSQGMKIAQEHLHSG